METKELEVTEAAEAAVKPAKDWDKITEIIVVVMLGITALLTAWASWIGSLHGGNQATNYTKSNNLAAEGNSEYNAAVQSMNQDMTLWIEISKMQLEIMFADDNGDDDTVDLLCYELFYMLDENVSEAFAEAIDWEYILDDSAYDDPTAYVLAWLEEDNATVSPFFDDDFLDAYFETANELLDESEALLEQGQQDNSNGDAFGLVTVIYSVVLFLLGISGSFKQQKAKYAVIIISAVAFVIGTIYMLTIPMPTGFSLTSFFG